MTETTDTTNAHSRSTVDPRTRCVLAVLLVLPYAYLGVLLATTVHEVVGHGLVAMAVGGGFHGFSVDLDGMGWAYVTPPTNTEEWRSMAIGAGGVTSTTVGGALLLLLCWLCRRAPWLAVPLLALAANLLLEGLPYVFWGAVSPTPAGDMAAIISWIPSRRIACIAIGGVGMIAAIWCITAMAMWLAESWLNSGQRFRGWRRLVALLFIGLGPGLVWFIFDWDQLAPGLGATPNIVGLALHLIAAASIAPLHWKTTPVESKLRHTLASAATGWTAAGAAIVAVVLWLQQLVVW